MKNFFQPEFYSNIQIKDIRSYDICLLGVHLKSEFIVHFFLKTYNQQIYLDPIVLKSLI